MAKKKGSIKIGMKPVKGLLSYTDSEGFIFLTRKFKNVDDLLLPTGLQKIECKEFEGRAVLHSQYIEDGQENIQVLAFEKVSSIAKDVLEIIDGEELGK